MQASLCAAGKGYCRAPRVCSSKITLLWELFKARVNRILKSSLFPACSHQIRNFLTSWKHDSAATIEPRDLQVKTAFEKRLLCDLEFFFFVENVPFHSYSLS